MTRDHKLALALLGSVCFLTGLLFFVAVPSPGVSAVARVSTPTPTVIPTLAVTPGTQFSILLVGVDSLASLQPRLELCWVVTFVPGAPEYYLLGFPPSATVQLAESDQAQSLADIYGSWDARGGGTGFTRRALQTMVSPGLTIQASVVFDWQMLRGVINDLGGINLRGQLLDGDTVLVLRDGLDPYDEAGRLAFEGDMLQAILQRDWAPEVLAPIMERGQHWEPTPVWFQQMAQSVVPLSRGKFIITIFPPGMATPAP